VHYYYYYYYYYCHHHHHHHHHYEFHVSGACYNKHSFKNYVLIVTCLTLVIHPVKCLYNIVVVRCDASFLFISPVRWSGVLACDKLVHVHLCCGSASMIVVSSFKVSGLSSKDAASPRLNEAGQWEESTDGGGRNLHFPLRFEHEERKIVGNSRKSLWLPLWIQCRELARIRCCLSKLTESALITGTHSSKSTKVG